MGRVAMLVVCYILVAGCSRISGSAALPAGSSSEASASSHSPAYGGYLSLYSFKGKATGGEPEAELVNVSGTLYGTTSEYGDGFGTVFSVSPFGKVRLLHKFQGDPDGAYPQAGLALLDGLLYGTTSAGGTHGGGTVFAIARDGAEHVVYNFGRPHDGSDPQSQLVVLRGVLYGTTLNGGSHGRGTVFAVTRSGSEVVLHSFAGAPTDGGHPSAGLTYVRGWFYGATRAGGKLKSAGAIFKINAIGREKVIHAFGVTSGDGENPAGKLLFYNDVLYGTTLHGGTFGRGLGTVFEMTIGGAEAVLHDFGSGTDGALPAAGLIQVKGELWGTTTGGGVSPRKSSQCISSGVTRMVGYYRCGTIFRIDKFGTERVAYRFIGDPDGANPEAALTDAGGILYGTTFWGGSSNYYGTIFRLLP
jgi:uncharacterized repeat protein (TIGR03803 family)